MEPQGALTQEPPCLLSITHYAPQRASDSVSILLELRVCTKLLGASQDGVSAD